MEPKYTLYTPNIPGWPGLRAWLQLDADGMRALSQAQAAMGKTKWQANVYDHASDRYVTVKAAPCGLGCYCAAELVTADDAARGPLAPYKRTKMNIRRREWTERAIDEFAYRTGQSMKHELAEIVGDLLCGIMHFCAQRKLDFDGLLRIARGHFEVERVGKED